MSLWIRLQFLDKRGQWISPTTYDNLSIKKIPATITNLQLFDQLNEHGIVRDSGMIKKCLDEAVEGVLVADELRKVSQDHSKVS